MSRFKPQGNMVMFQLIPTRKLGTLHLAPNKASAKKLDRFKVLEVGPGRVLDDGTLVPIDMNPGDLIVIAGKIHMVDERKNIGLVDARDVIGLRLDDEEWADGELEDVTALADLNAEAQEAAAAEAKAHHAIARPLPAGQPVPPGARIIGGR